METHVFLETRGSHWGLDDVTENSCRPFEMTIMGIVILLNEFASFLGLWVIQYSFRWLSNFSFTKDCKSRRTLSNLYLLVIYSVSRKIRARQLLKMWSFISKKKLIAMEYCQHITQANSLSQALTTGLTSISYLRWFSIKLQIKQLWAFLVSSFKGSYWSTVR